MNCSFQAKVALIHSALRDETERTEHMRRHMFEGVFWMLDLLEQEIESRNPPNASYLRPFVAILKSHTEEAFKTGNPLHEFDTRECCTKLLSFGPRDKDPSQQ